MSIDRLDEIQQGVNDALDAIEPYLRWRAQIVKNKPRPSTIVTPVVYNAAKVLVEAVIIERIVDPKARAA